MTKCDGCGNEVGKLYCGHCREIVEKKYEKFKPSPKKLVALLLWDVEKKAYRMGCQCILCPCNQNGVCGVVNKETLEMLMLRMHEFDGDNIIRQVCG